MEKRDLVERWFTKIWEQADMSALDELLSASVGDGGAIDGMVFPRHELPELVNVVRELIGPPRVRILRFLEDGDWCSTHYEMTSEGPDRQMPLRVEGMILIRVDKGRIAELTTKFDSFELFEQLGQLPPEALVTCLTGQKLVWG
ncbi:nuclear transport factor 2 family protein [Parasedimentitalea maritima]|uniref:Nuclear transport factor 2 family protein n=1 Tax=Parasedimentitalea maritima TaxID=2578117 RepID=A0ABY2UPG7_9RHOB|nr:nuclear transport factor 2 family protein [Zongyanglinia marina]TLP56564.1 nuclear transport factor 2 family protein [Zongyanglinia marina]